MKANKKLSVYSDRVIKFAANFSLQLFILIMSWVLKGAKFLSQYLRPVFELVLVVILFIIEKQLGDNLPQAVDLRLGVVMSLLICWAFTHLFTKLGVPMKWSFIPFSMAFAYFLYVFVTVKGIPFGWYGFFCAIGIYLCMSFAVLLLKAAWRNFKRDEMDYSTAYLLLSAGFMGIADSLLGWVFRDSSCHLFITGIILVIGCVVLLYSLLRDHMQGAQ